MTIPENTSRSRTARPAPTLHDVAAAAGVSLATASRVLNGSERKVAESFRERVERAAAELGYTANVSAQTIARGTSPVIALLVADIADPYFGLIASGVARGADEQGLIVTIAITEREPQREARILHALRGQRPRGVILAASRAGERDAAAVDELTEFASLGGRTVTFGEGGDRSIRIPNREGSEELGRSMAALGYRRAIGIGASEGVSTSDDRLAGFTAGFTAGGGEVVRVHRGTFERESGTASMTEALAAGVEPGTLIFALSDVVAIGAMTDHSRPWVTAHSTRPAASTAKLGARAEMTCEAVRQTRLKTSARRRGQCAVQRTSGNVVRAATSAYHVSSVPTRTTLTCRLRAIEDSAPTGRISAVT